MKIIRLLLVASAAFFIVGTSEAQSPGSVTNHAFAVGKGSSVQGFSSVACSSTQIPIGQTSADPSCKTLSGDVTNDATGVMTLGASKVVNAKIATGAITNDKLSSNAIPIISSRSAAGSLDLSAFSLIQTQGYSSAGDGGGALFKNAGTAGYLDAQPLTGTISAAGSGYVNASYTGVPLSTGQCNAVANVTVSGTAVTSVTLIGLKGAGCKSGDVLTTANNNLGGAGSGFTWTVSTVSNPVGSFADTAGNHWQIIPDLGGMLNVLQFGAKADWTATGGDAAATDNFTAFTGSQIYSSNGVGSADAGGYAASTILIPKGTYKICGGLVTADGATLRGLGITTSVLKQCDSDTAATHFVTICNPQSLHACFGGRLSNLQLFPGTGSANANVAMIYTNNAQQTDVIDNVSVYGGKRMCLFGDTGYGGAANFISKTLFCTTNSTSAQPQAIAVTYGAAAITFTDTVVESGGAYSGSGFFISTGGIWSIRGGHSENIATPIFTNITGANTTVEIFGYTGGANCTSVITRQGGSTANLIEAGRINPNGCTNAINNAGTPTTGLVVDNTKF